MFTAEQHLNRLKIFAEMSLSDHRNSSAPIAPAEARRILNKLAWHDTPRHASGLNRAASELRMVSRPGLAGRMPDAEPLKRELTADEQRRHAAHATIPWRFTVQKARRKLPRLYPSIAH
jgi:hypothetical protein